MGIEWKHILLLLLSFSCVPVQSAQVSVFAASSLTDSLKKVAAKYERDTGDKIVFNFAASSLLARQIEEGAPADIFFSADEAKMDGLAAKGLIVKGTRSSPLSNMLVIVAPDNAASSIHSVYELTNGSIKRVALGDPKTVPIGIYAREYVEKLGLWKTIEPKLLIVENVRAALAAVEAGNADAAFVYRTDARIGKRVKIAVEVPVKEGPPISYSVALIKNAPHEGPGGRFLKELKSDAAANVFRRFGFIVRQESPK